jgi:hypothetical protein
MQKHDTDPARHLTRCEAAYVVAALKLTLDQHDSRLLPRDCEIMSGLIRRLAAGLDLDEEVRRALDA